MSDSTCNDSYIVSTSVERSKTSISHTLYWFTQEQKFVGLSKSFTLFISNYYMSVFYIYDWKENSFLVVCSIRFGHKISELPIFPMKFKHVFVQIIEIWKFNRTPEFIDFLIPSKNVLIWSTSSLTKSLQVSFSLQDTKISWYSKSLIVKFVNNSFKSTICL